MKLKKLSKRITITICMIIILFSLFYTSIVIGTLTHELMHKDASIQTSMIQINYDTSGATHGSFFRHSHEWVYLNGMIVQTTLFATMLICLLLIIYTSKKGDGK